MARRTEPGANDRIRLQLPAEAAYGRLARIAATTLARRLGFGFRAIEDLGLALDETLILLLSDPRTGPEAAVEVVLDVDGDDLAVDVSLLGGTPAAAAGDAGAHGGGDGLGDEALGRFRFLVGETVAEWAVDVEAPTVHLLARR